jgi:hypothetical protein
MGRRYSRMAEKEGTDRKQPVAGKALWVVCDRCPGASGERDGGAEPALRTDAYASWQTSHIPAAARVTKPGTTTAGAGIGHRLPLSSIGRALLNNAGER